MSTRLSNHQWSTLDWSLSQPQYYIRALHCTGLYTLWFPEWPVHSIHYSVVQGTALYCEHFLHFAALCTLYISVQCVQCVQCTLLCTVNDVQVAAPQGKALTDHFRNRTKDFCWLSATPDLAVWFPQISIAACRYTVLNGFDCVSYKVQMFPFPACHGHMNENGDYVFVPKEHLTGNL